MDKFLASSFGSFVIVLVQGLFTAPSWQSFALLACGWALAPTQHTNTTSLWLTGAATLKHFSRFYVFLSCPFYRARWRVWECIIRHAAQLTPAEAPIVIEFDDTTKKKAGRHIEGVACYHNGAGSALQEYRTLRGLNFVLGVMRVLLQLWPGHPLIVPIGLELYLNEEQARPHHPPSSVEAFFTTDLSLNVEDILQQYRDRWAVEITIRDSRTFDGLGQDQCRKLQRMVGANTFRLVTAAAPTLWFLEQAKQRPAMDLQCYRPWYRQKCAPGQLDIAWACREALLEAGVFPIPRFTPGLAENHAEQEHALSSAA